MKLRSTCEIYTRIKVPYKYQQTVKELSKKQNIVNMKQYKSSGLVIMDKSECREKCLRILENDNFKMTDQDSTKNFLEQIRMKQVPDGYKMVSFGTKPLFTNVPLGKAIEINLRRIYERKEINISIRKKGNETTSNVMYQRRQNLGVSP